MAEVYDTPQMIARDLTLAAIEKIPSQNTKMSPETIGKTVGEIYQTILENVQKRGGEGTDEHRQTGY